MRAYVTATGGVFALLALAHFARLLAEGAGPLRSPIFVLTTLAALLLAGWAARLLTAPGRKNRNA